MEKLDCNQLLIRQEFMKYEQKYRIALESIKNIQGYSEKYDHILDLCEEIVSDANFARCQEDGSKYNTLDGYTFRLFNGMFYDRVCSRDIVDELVRFLRKGGISMSTIMRIDKRINLTVLNVIRRKILHPRLTLMCFTNGVVDFTKSKLILRSFSPDYDVVKQYDFAFDLKKIKDCELWKNFLGEPYNFQKNEDGVLPELSKRRQLQTFLGSILLDRSKVSFEYFLILQGDGGNGKSVIFRVLESLFGAEEVSTMDLSQFSRSGDEKLRAAANLQGKRIMYCPEETIKSSKNLNFIKSMASGEPMPMRKLGGNIESVQSPPVIMFNTNHKWKVSDFLNSEDLNDQSMVRRVKIINFERVIPVEKRDTRLAERLMHEKAGIFAWIVKGFLELRKNRYRMPESKQGQVDLILEKARSKVMYDDKEVSGIVALYFERKYTTPDFRIGTMKVDVSFDKLYANFLDFCKREGLDAVTIQKFGRDMTTMGFDKDKNSKNGAITYYMYCEDRQIGLNFTYHVPTIIDEVRASIFEGDEYTEEEFDAYIDAVVAEEKLQRELEQL